MNLTTKSFRPDSYRWRATNGLQTWTDITLRYRMKRHPRGQYRIPLPDDLIAEEEK